ncbi:hypothetical protein IW262DRAFT_1482213 [Armillaria fumosa]|nr:hypothetical protein IW262DRAFT_1482213 [Armillaria fumosa]
MKPIPRYHLVNATKEKPHIDSPPNPKLENSKTYRRETRSQQYCCGFSWRRATAMNIFSNIRDSDGTQQQRHVEFSCISAEIEGGGGDARNLKLMMAGIRHCGRARPNLEFTLTTTTCRPSHVLLRETYYYGLGRYYGLSNKEWREGYQGMDNYVLQGIEEIERGASHRLFWDAICARARAMRAITLFKSWSLVYETSAISEITRLDRETRQVDVHKLRRVFSLPLIDVFGQSQSSRQIPRFRTGEP